MRFAALLRKSLIETLRDWKILSLTLIFAPLFVVLMRFYVGESAEGPYRVVLVNQDEGASNSELGDLNAGEQLIELLSEATDSQGAPIFEIELASELSPARERLSRGGVDLVVHLPRGLSRTLMEAAQGADPPPVLVRTYGDLSNANYLMAAVWSDMLTYEFTAEAIGSVIPIEIQANTMSGSQSMNEFDLYVPALLALAAMMLMFTAAAALIREKDKGTIIRLRLSNMTTLEWLAAVSVTQLLVGILAMALTYLTAVSLGYQHGGSLWTLLIIGVLASLSIIGISVLVSAYLRTIFDLLTVGCFPFFLLMFFSGGMFPLPPVRLFTVGGRVIELNEVLPTTHAITAMGRVLRSEAGLGEIGYELAAMAFLTVAFYAVGVGVFTRRHMRAAA